MLMMVAGLLACHNDEPKGYDIEQVMVQVVDGPAQREGIEVRLVDSRGTVFTHLNVFF